MNNSIFELFFSISLEAELISNKYNLSNYYAFIKNKYDIETLEALNSHTQYELTHILVLSFYKCLTKIHQKKQEDYMGVPDSFKKNGEVLIAGTQLNKYIDERKALRQYLEENRIFYIFYFLFNMMLKNKSSEQISKFKTNFKPLLDLGKDYENLITSLSTTIFDINKIRLQKNTNKWSYQDFIQALVENRFNVIDNFWESYVNRNWQVIYKASEKHIEELNSSDYISKITNLYEKFITQYKEDGSIDAFQKIKSIEKKSFKKDALLIMPFLLDSNESSKTFMAYVKDGLYNNLYSVLILSYLYNQIIDINESLENSVLILEKNLITADFLSMFLSNNYDSLFKKEEKIFKQVFTTYMSIDEEFKNKQGNSLQEQFSFSNLAHRAYQSMMCEYNERYFEENKKIFDVLTKRIIEVMKEYAESNEEELIQPSALQEYLLKNAVNRLKSNFCPINISLIKQDSLDLDNQYFFSKDDKHKNRLEKMLCKTLATYLYESFSNASIQSIKG